MKLIRGRNIQVQVKAAAALESLADHNARVQEEFLKLNAPVQLVRLLKVCLWKSWKNVYHRSISQPWYRLNFKYNQREPGKDLDLPIYLPVVIVYHRTVI